MGEIHPIYCDKTLQSEDDVKEYTEQLISNANEQLHEATTLEAYREALHNMGNWASLSFTLRRFLYLKFTQRSVEEPSIEYPSKVEIKKRGVTPAKYFFPQFSAVDKTKPIEELSEEELENYADVLYKLESENGCVEFKPDGTPSKTGIIKKKEFLNYLKGSELELGVRDRFMILTLALGCNVDDTVWLATQLGTMPYNFRNAKECIVFYVQQANLPKPYLQVTRLFEEYQNKLVQISEDNKNHLLKLLEKKQSADYLVQYLSTRMGLFSEDQISFAAFNSFVEKVNSGASFSDCGYNNPYEMLAFYMQRLGSYSNYDIIKQAKKLSNFVERNATRTVKREIEIIKRGEYGAESDREAKLLDYLISNQPFFSESHFSVTAYNTFDALIDEVKVDGKALIVEWAEAKAELQNEGRRKTISDEQLGIYFKDAFMMGQKTKNTNKSYSAPEIIKRGFLSGERIRAIRNREQNVLKRDILFLSFVKYAMRTHLDFCLADEDEDDFSEEVRRDMLDEFQYETDNLLGACNLGQIYPAAPYDNAILVALASRDPMEFFRNI